MEIPCSYPQVENAVFMNSSSQSHKPSYILESLPFVSVPEKCLLLPCQREDTSLIPHSFYFSPDLASYAAFYYLHIKVLLLHRLSLSLRKYSDCFYFQKENRRKEGRKEERKGGKEEKGKEREGERGFEIKRIAIYFRT